MQIFVLIVLHRLCFKVLLITYIAQWRVQEFVRGGGQNSERLFQGGLSSENSRENNIFQWGPSSENSRENDTSDSKSSKI